MTFTTGNEKAEFRNHLLYVSDVSFQLQPADGVHKVFCDVLEVFLRYLYMYTDEVDKLNEIFTDHFPVADE
jgi:hypothetical protein